MTEQDYLIAWAVYAVAALGCLLVGFRITVWLWRWLREPLRVLIAVLLCSPTLVDPVRDYYAPAIAVTALDVLFKVGGNLWQAVSDLAMFGMIGFVLYLLFVAIRWPLARWRKAKRQAAEDARAPTMSEMLEQRVVGDGRVEPRL